MASIIQLLLQAQNNTGPAFAGVRTNLAGVNAAAGQTRSGLGALGTAQQQTATSARTLASLQHQVERATLGVRLASTDAAGRVRILTEEYTRLSRSARQAGLSQEHQARATLAAANAQRQLVQAQNAQGRGLGPALPRTLEQFGTGALAQLGGIFAVQQIGQHVLALGNETADLAMRAETIGTAYEGATRRAGVGAVDLLGKLKEASRGTISETELMATSNAALALHVGQNVQEVGNLMAIARQKGKDFGLTTQEAFNRLIYGLGKAEPEILDELGILIDANKIYGEYAKSIGVSASELTKQQKVIAVTNEVLRTNSDLVQKNADAQIDAADRVAQAEARSANAKARAGRATAPIKASVEESKAAVFEGLFRTTREDAASLNQTLLAASSSYADYVARVQVTRKEIQGSHWLAQPMQEELQLAMVIVQQYDLARALAVQADAHERNAAAATANADALTRLGNVEFKAPVRPTRATRFSGFGIQRPDYVSMARPDVPSVPAASPVPAYVQSTRGSVPLSMGRAQQIVPNVPISGSASASMPAAPLPQVNITVQGHVLTSRDLADVMMEAIQNSARQNGYEVTGDR